MSESAEIQPVAADPGPDRELAALIGEEQARAEALLNRIRAVVVALLGIAALAYTPQISPALARVNMVILLPVLAWTAWQQRRYHRPGGYRRWLAWANPAIDIAGITLLQAGYGLIGEPGLAIHTPVFLAYFAVLATRPLTGSPRQAAVTTLLTALAYAALPATFLMTGRLHLLAGPLDFGSLDAVSALNEATKVLMLLTVGAISTYATAWNERILRRALAAQVRRGAEERELAIRLQEADKLSAIGTIAAAAVHEVRNPLTTIGLQAEMLLRTKLDSEQRGDVEHIVADARRAAAFVQDLLRVTRSSTAGDSTSSVSVPAVVEAALTAAGPLLRDQKVLAKAVFDVAGEGLALHGSAGALERAVLNIVVNSIQAMAGQVEAKTIRLEVSAVGAPRGLSLVITDNGPGFSPASAARAFERFFTTKPPGKGTGLGLWIVRETVAQFGGTVEIEAAADRGARIRLQFPLPHLAESNGKPTGGAARMAQLANAAG
jgi:signal transduction histidine kinase